MNRTRRGAAAACTAAALCVPLLGGCTETLPTPPSGILSVIHQKTLKKATDRALDQAKVTSEQYGKSKVQLTFDLRDANPDLGKQHVKSVIAARFRTAAAEVASNADADALPILCQILLAGADISTGECFGFRWVDTKAEVQLRIIEKDPDKPAQREGTGVATYNQTWWLGMGPWEKLK